MPASLPSIAARVLLTAALALTAAAGCGERPLVEGRRVGEWVLDLHAIDPRARLRAAHALAGFGDHARLAIKPLAAALRDPVVAVREQAAYALGGIGGDATSFVAPVLAAPGLDPETARWAALALALIGRQDRVARDALIAASSSSELVPRVAALRALGLTGDESVVGKLLEVLGGVDPLAQRDAAVSLARMHGAGRAAISTLVGLVRVDDRDLVLAALTALGAVGRGVDPGSAEGHALASALAAAVPHHDPLVRGLAARTAADVGLADAGALTQVGVLLGDANAGVRDAAAHALAALAPSVLDATVATLVSNAAEPGDEASRLGAIRALGGLGARGAAAIEPLGTLTKERNPELKRAAAEALGKLVTARTKSTPAAT